MKRPPNRFSRDKEHRSYGIQNWLLKVNLATNKKHNDIDNVLYLRLMKNYCRANDWKPMKKTHLSEFEQKELFIHNNFYNFTQYCQKYGKIAIKF